MMNSSNSLMNINKNNKIDKIHINNNLNKSNKKENDKKIFKIWKRDDKVNDKNNSPKIWNDKSSNRNDYNLSSNKKIEKNNIINKIDINYNKYGNKSKSKNKEINYSKNNYIKKFKRKINYKINTKKNIKQTKTKINESYNNSNRNIHHNKSLSNYSFKSNSPKKINLKNIKNNNNNKSGILMENSSSALSDEKKSSDSLKIILINKVNNQINELIQGKEKMYLNENNNLFFLGFCDLLFEIGFLHIKETEINDISQIDKHINDLYTQPFTNRDLLSENFLFNEQHLLICAWKTILNNFNLIKNFDKLPEENEEITIDDCKLFVFIVTGLFIGYNNKYLNEKKNNSDRNNAIKNNSLSNINSSPNIKNQKKIIKNISPNAKLNKSFSKNNNNSAIKNKYQFRKKNINHKNTNSFNENILKTILENKNKSNYNYKSILKIKNYFNYFAELRKLYNLYKKDLKNMNKKIDMEKDLTFHPKTNKNNNILIERFAPSMDFFERNALIKKRNEKKKLILQRERSQRMLKECSFEPFKNNNSSNKKEQKYSMEISNRLNNNSKRKRSSNNSSNTNSNFKLIEDKLTNSENYQNKKIIHSKNIIRNSKIRQNNSYFIDKKNLLKRNMINLKLNPNNSPSKIHNSYTYYNKVYTLSTTN